jgi:hypothetical protein
MDGACPRLRKPAIPPGLPLAGFLTAKELQTGAACEGARDDAMIASLKKAADSGTVASRLESS